MSKGYFVCYSCGKRAELSTEERPCEVLSGWLTVSHWKGPGAVEHYNFCSFACLETWADAQAPKIPEAFLRAFQEEKDE